MKAETTVEFSQADLRSALIESAYKVLGVAGHDTSFELTFFVGGKEIANDKPVEARLRVPRES